MEYILAILIAIGIFKIQSAYYRRNWSTHLQVRIEYDRTTAYPGESVTLRECVRNYKLLPLPSLSVKFSVSKTLCFDTSDNAVCSDQCYRNDIFSILGHQQVERRFRIRPTARGYFPITSLQLVVNDLFMQKTYASMQSNHTALHVLPQPLTDAVSLETLHSLIGEAEQQRRCEDFLTFETIRDYMPGDSLRRMNWKASARTAEWKVNTYTDVQSRHVALILNLHANSARRNPAMEEYCIRVAATLLHEFCEAGCQLQLFCNGTDCITGQSIATSEGSGTAQYLALMQTLARIDLSGELCDIHPVFHALTSGSANAEDTLYLFVSNDRNEALLQTYQNAVHSGLHITYLCPDSPAACGDIPWIHYLEVHEL